MQQKILFLLGLLFSLNAPAQTPFRFAVGSCANYAGEEGDSIFRSIAADHPSFFFWLGDNVYYNKIDYASPAGMRKALQKRFNHPYVRQFLSDIPQRAIWDDHDYGPNDADSQFVHAQASQKIFAQFWKATPTQVGKYHDIRWVESQEGLVFIGLDDRSHRGPVGSHMLGVSQLHWLKSELVKAADQGKTHVFIAVGSQVLNTAEVFENMSRFNDRSDFLAILDVFPGRVILLTGDRHHGEINLLERPHRAFPIVEITSSALTSKLYSPSPKEIDANQTLLKVVGGHQYTLIEVLPQDGKVQVTFKGRKGEILHQDVF